MKTRAFYSFATFFVITSLLLSSCAAMATPEPTPTNTPVPPPTDTPEPTLTSTSTPKPTVTVTPTITPNATATQKVEELMAKVQEYYDAKYISSSDGTYTLLKDYKKAFAQINYYQWYPTDLSPTNFVLKSDITWRSASSAADSSGCGYVFRLQDNADNDHYMFFISLKGYVEVATMVANRWKSLGRGVYGNPAQNGGANVALIAEDSTIRVLVDDKLIKTYNGFAGKLTRGDLAYTVISGINTSFGTECKFTNTELWEITQK